MGDLHRVLLDARVRRLDEHRAQILDVRLEAADLVPVGPVYEDVLGVALVQSDPVLVGENGVLMEIPKEAFGNWRTLQVMR